MWETEELGVSDGCRVSSLSLNQADPALCEASILQ